MKTTEHLENFPRIMIAGTGSGCGKTTVTCALLKALSDRGLSVAGFKCGPDYIDPMFLSRITGSEAHNLDTRLCGEKTVFDLFVQTASGADFSIIEGVMGLYDGIALDSEVGSSNHISALTETPELLVVDVKGLGLSLAAVIQGYLSFRPNRIQAIILNHCSLAMFHRYQELIQKQCSVPVIGYFPDMPEVSIGSRHLGLVTASEISDLEQKLDLLAKTVKETVDLDELIRIGHSAAALSCENTQDAVVKKSSIRIGVAKDQAFCFMYRDNLDLLERMGAELFFFSPLEDRELPKNINGLLLYGGYPEEYLPQLSNNRGMCETIYRAVTGGMPTIAECGGFLYLLERFTGRDGNCYPLVGAIHGAGWMTDKLVRFGYADITAKEDNLLFKQGESIPVHEFHYSDSDCNGTSMTARKGKREWECIHATKTLFAGYPHIHLGGHSECAERFLEACRAYQISNER